jgi:hypothetical protein
MSGPYVQTVVPMPSNWLEAINFKTPNKDDKLGYIDPIKRGTTFRLISAGEEPLLVKAVRTPFDCFTKEDCLGKGRGKLTVRVQLNDFLWKSLSSLDKTFSNFLVEHRVKLFSPSDAAHIGRDNSVVNLKMKTLAPSNPDGSPQTEGFITVRINGRCTEIESLEIKDGSSGRYVGAVKWMPRTSPLPATATRISLVTGVDAKQNHVMRDTLPIEGPVPVGSQRVRYVGPGDISPKGSMLRYGLLRPAYWSIAPGGGASITLVMDTMVVQNLSEDTGGEPAEARMSVPEGFAAYEEDSSSSSSSSDIVQFDKKRRLAFDGDDDERAHFQSPVAQAAGGNFSIHSKVAPAAPKRAATGGPAVFSTDLAKLVEEQKLYEARIEREHHIHKKDSAYQCTQIPEPEEDSLDE